MGAAKVEVALKCIEFDPRLKTVMEMIFGNSFVVESSKEGQKLAYKEGGYRKAAVSKMGDKYDPAGTMSGGGNGQNSRSVLNDIALYKTKSQEVNIKRKEFLAVDQVYKKLYEEYPAFQRKEGDLTCLKMSLDSMKNQLENDRAFQVKQDIDRKEAELNEASEYIANQKTIKKDLETKEKKLTSDVANIEKTIGERRKKLGAEEKQIKKDIEPLEKDLKGEREKLANAEAQWESAHGAQNTFLKYRYGVLLSSDGLDFSKSNNFQIYQASRQIYKFIKHHDDN